MERRLFFPLDKGNIDLRNKIKSIENRRWHTHQKRWSVPDNETNRTFLENHGLHFSVHKAASSPTKPTPGKVKEPRVELPDEIKARISEMRRWMEQKRYSHSTIKTYLSFLYQFFAFYKDKAYDSISTEDIVEYNFFARL